MTVLIVLVVLLGILCGFMKWARSRAHTFISEPPPSEEELMQARLELHRIGRGVDSVLAKHHAESAAERTRQAIADALDEQ